MTDSEQPTEREGKQNINFKSYNELIIGFGGAAFVAYALRHRFLGKVLRCLELPDANLTTISIKRNSIQALKQTIITNQPSIYPGVALHPNDIKISTFIHPQFAEPITSNKHVRMLEEGDWVLWSQLDREIPKSGVSVKGCNEAEYIKLSNETERDHAIQIVNKFPVVSVYDPEQSPSSTNFLVRLFKGSQPQEFDRPLTVKERDTILDLLFQQDNQILTLYRKSVGDPKEFKRRVLEYIKKKTNKQTNE